jgi:hypothetical protein
MEPTMMTRRRPKPRLNTKKYERALARFTENVRGVLARYNAQPYRDHGEERDEYTLQTPAGELWVGIRAREAGYHPAIMQRFEDPERARAFKSNFGGLLNPYSGKFNFHFDIETVADIENLEYISWWATFIEWLMEQPPVPAPTERYEVVRRSDGKVLSNRHKSQADADQFVTWLVTSGDVQPHAAHELPPDRAAYEARRQPDPAAVRVSGIYFYVLSLKREKDVRIAKV